MDFELLTSIDTAWLRLEHPTSPMMITFVLVFDAPLDFKELKAVIGRRLLCFTRFRQRVAQPKQARGKLCWVADPSFDLGAHLQRMALPSPGDRVALESLVGALISTPLDLSRPLWQFQLVEPYEGGCALVGRVHHALADGPALMQVLLSLTDPQPDAFLPAGGQAGTDQPLSIPDLGAAARMAEVLVQEGLAVVSNPRHLLDLARLGSGSATVLRKLVLRPPDPETLFRGELGIAKRATWSRPLSLADVKVVGRVIGGTVNDVILAAVTGALRRYMISRGQAVQGLNIRAGLSVNLRSPSDGLSLGNQAGAVLVSLPVGLADPWQRLVEAKRRMDELKSSPEAAAVRALLQALGRATPEVQDMLVQRYCTRDTAVIANVPGPGETVYLAGVPLSALLFWVPAFGRVGLSLNIISYAGQLRLSIVTDEGLVPDPEAIVAGFHLEFEKLLALAKEVQPGQRDSEPSVRTMKAMSANLDRLLATLDALLQDDPDVDS